MSESLTQKKIRAHHICEILDARYSEAKCALDYWDDPFKLVIAVMLSAQTTDAAVNKVTVKLWEAYKDASALANANEMEVEQILHSIGLYKTKAARAIAIANMIVNQFDGKVPNTIEELQKLPGVGRKTANIVMSEAFRNPVGIAVDTHVNRITHKLGLVSTKIKDPNEVEQRLLKIYDKCDWGKVNHQFVLFGREICNARHPKCTSCPIFELCSACAF